MSRQICLLLVQAALILCVSTCALAEPPAWDELQAFYAYDSALPLCPVAGEPVDRGTITVQTVRFASANREVVPATLCLPKNVQKPPVVLFLHGLGGSRNNATQMIAPFVCQKGIAVISIDAQYHGDRKVEGKELFSSDIETMVKGFQQTIIDNRRAIDYVASRPDLDASRIVLVGASMGAIMGSVAAAVDDRLKAAFLIVGGGDWFTLFAKSQIGQAKGIREALGGLEPYREMLGFVEPVSFAGHISPRPVQMLNGKDDQIVPAACGQALFDALKEPRSIEWYSGAANQGHIPPIDVAYRTLREFLESQGLWPAEGAAPAAPAAGAGQE